MTQRAIPYFSFPALILLFMLPGRYRAAEFEMTPVDPMPNQVRDQIYNEVLVVFWSRDGFKAVVYNDIGFPTLTVEDLETLDTREIAREFNAILALLNAPRIFVMDEISASVVGQAREIQGFMMNHVAVVDVDLRDVQRAPYEESTVARSTRYVYYAGNPMYRLIADDGTVYTMQSASREIDPMLSVQDLETLGERLSLPEGWRYEVVIPETDITLDIEGSAIVLQDEFRNSYQRQ